MLEYHHNDNNINANVYSAVIVHCESSPGSFD